MTQTNVKSGPIILSSADDLTAKNGYLVKIKNDSGKAKFALPDATTDLALFVVVDGDDTTTAALPISPERDVRLKLSGTCNPGDVLVLAVPDGTVDGAVRALPADPGTYRGIAIAEEAGVDGQDILARPALVGYITQT